MFTREHLALIAAMNPHGRACDYQTRPRFGFVMATIKDANDSLRFMPIESYEFKEDQAWLAANTFTPSMAQLD